MTSTILPRFNLTPEITAWRGGEGPSLVLIHGVGLSADAWSEMLPGLTRHFTVTAIDMPGHGGSEPLLAKRHPTLDDYVTAIAKALNILDEPSIIVGHSMGALVSMELAIHHRHLTKIAIPLNAIYRRSNDASMQIKARAKELQEGKLYDPSGTLDRWFEEGSDDAYLKMRKRCEYMLNSIDKQTYSQAYNVFANSDGPNPDELKTVTMPMLFMTGAQEPNSTPEMSRAMTKLVPNSKCEIIENARHMMTMTHADEVNRKILNYAKSEVNADE